MVNQKACEIFLEHLKNPTLPADTDMVKRVTRKGLINAYISNEKLGYQKNDDDSNTVPKPDKNFYYDKKEKSNMESLVENFEKGIELQRLRAELEESKKSYYESNKFIENSQSWFHA